MIDFLETIDGIVSGVPRALTDESEGFASAGPSASREQVARLLQWCKSGGNIDLQSRVSAVWEMAHELVDFLRRFRSSVINCFAFDPTAAIGIYDRITKGEPILAGEKYVLLHDIGKWSMNNDRLVIRFMNAVAGNWKFKKGKPGISATLNGVVIDADGMTVDVEKRVFGFDVARDVRVTWS